LYASDLILFPLSGSGWLEEQVDAACVRTSNWGEAMEVEDRRGTLTVEMVNAVPVKFEDFDSE